MELENLNRKRLNHPVTLKFMQMRRFISTNFMRVLFSNPSIWGRN